jgi:hypothetical protein
MVVICKVGNKEFKQGQKVRVRYPAMTSGYIQYTFCSRAAALAYKKTLNSNQRNRVKITPVR